MAVTGKSYVPISAGPLEAGMPSVEVKAEASSQTALRGAPVVLTSGYATECSGSPTSIYGFLERAASNGASDGAEDSYILRAAPGRRFTGTLNATLTQAMIGSTAALLVGSSTWHLDTTASKSDSQAALIEGPAPGFAIGDTDPEVIFVLLNDVIQGNT